MLGTTPIDRDDYIIQALVYQCETNTGPRLRPDIFAAFEWIALERDTQQLGLTLVMARSQGLYTRHQLDEAYSLLDISPAEQEHMSEEDIIEAYNKRLPRSPAEEVPRRALREAMALIGTHINAEMIQAVLMSTDVPAEPTLKESYEALGLDLEAGGQCNDQLILTLFEGTTNEQPALLDKYKLALTVIARERKSDMLKRYLESGSKRAFLEPGESDAYSYE